jgi:hypothetical protein
MESDGCLLEFIAAAHSHKARNTQLNIFVRKNLFALLEPSVSTQQLPQSELLLQISSPPVEDADIGANDRDSAISKSAASRDIKSPNDDTLDELPVLEGNQDKGLTQLTPFPRKTIPIDNPQEDPITLAYSHVRMAREKMQPVYEIFKTSGKISEPPIVESIEQAKKSIDGISDLFVDIPTPDYVELDYKLACEERYLYERISIVAAYALQDENISSPSVFQGANREFKKIFSSLQNLENFIKQFQEQIQLSNHANKSLFGNSI